MNGLTLTTDDGVKDSTTSSSSTDLLDSFHESILRRMNVKCESALKFPPSTRGKKPPPDGQGKAGLLRLEDFRCKLDAEEAPDVPAFG